MFNIIKILADANIEYVVVGGLAVALHGYQRVTMDVDVVVAMNRENVQKLIACAKAADMRPVIPVSIDSLAQPELIEQWHNEKGMLAFGLRGTETMATVMDVLVKSVVPFSDLLRDATIVEVGVLNLSA
ncbi:MAG: hypothetical protein WC091_03585 [Sulfuricellaceae bacterium]